ncbi:MAG: hypothetical protein K1X78_20970 [Verrucomicrobiaceae bacterium]|nr:hypothetical protein [Verrucomicrobiaceae bacterium]
MRTTKPISQMTPEEKATLKALMLAEGMDDSDVFPGVLGNKISAFLNKPLRRRMLTPRRKATA